MPRIVRLFVLAGALAGALSHPAAAAAPSSITVSGLAGSYADLIFSSAVGFSNGGSDTVASADGGGWGGVAVVALDGNPVDRDHLLAMTFPEAFRCPAASCPWTAGGPPVLSSSESGAVVLPAGRYRVVLIGDDGARITATLRPNGATGAEINLAASGRAHNYKASVTTGIGAPGHDSALRAYDQIAPGGRWGVAAMYDLYALLPAGAQSVAGCVTAGSNNAVTATVGGIAPCGDFQGEDFIFGPYSGPSTPVAGYAPIGSSMVAVSGTSDTTMGAGFEQFAVAPQSYLRAVFVGFELP